MNFWIERKTQEFTFFLLKEIYQAAGMTQIGRGHREIYPEKTMIAQS